MSELPSDWKTQPLGDGCQVQGGFAFKSGDYTKNGNGVPIIKIGDLQNGRVIVGKKSTRVSDVFLENKSLEKFLLRNGDILIAMTGATTGKIGKYDSSVSGNAYLNQRVGRFLVNNESLLQEFIQFLAQTNMFQQQIQENILAAAQGNISPNKLESIPIPLPPLPEQKQIAHILSTVQRAIEVQERIIQTTTELKKALMHKLFTEGLRNEPQKQTEIGPVPESWEVTTVQDLVDRGILDKPIDGNHGEIHPKVSDFVSEGIPFIMASDLKGGLVDLKTCNFLTKERADRLRKGFSLPGDVLISHKATIGETAIVPVVEHYIMLTPQVTYYRVLDNDALSNEYLRCYFDSPTFQKPLKNIASDGSTRAYIGITKQRGLPVLLPKINEQRELAKISGRLDEKIRQAIAKKNACSQLFRTLLHELMTAKIRTN